MFSKRLKVILSVSILILAMIQPSTLLMADDNAENPKVELYYGDIDTAYKIIKLLSVKNPNAGEQAEIDNENEIRSVAEKLEANAAIYVDHRETSGGEIYSDAIVVKYLNAEEIEKRNKKAKKPPEFKKEHPLDPEPILIEYGDVKFPYKVLGIIYYRALPEDDLESSQDMDYKLIELAEREDANAVIYVQYIRSGSQVSGGYGIMIEAMDTWDEVAAAKKKEKERRERLLKMIKEQQEKKKQEQNKN